MTGIGALRVLSLQEAVEGERARDHMDGVDRRRSLKERLGLKGIGCCGASWGLGVGPSTIRVLDDDDDDDDDQVPEQEEIQEAETAGPDPDPDPGPGPYCLGRAPPARTAAGMNLATALAAERHFRAVQDPDGRAVEAAEGGDTPWRVSLMRLLAETDSSGGAAWEREGEKGRCDWVCCVCMGRKKGAAFIPCGHTFCRVCSRELWLNRGTCPLCNRSIVEILDLF
ncbi:uncharacterized protein LOC131154285 [Malania oleifera]|uniref:uncharacterized protein LOC131154285 n=1 Tax=Malania oleifera TaxID=397392 RepID=UPI0025AE4AA2|nr:uncharacterized protein LOC131154285 [Malania oleifera]